MVATNIIPVVYLTQSHKLEVAINGADSEMGCATSSVSAEFEAEFGEKGPCFSLACEEALIADE